MPPGSRSSLEATTAADRAPDVAGSMVGWRAWRVGQSDTGVWLASVTCDYAWSPGRWNLAECWRTAPHVAPAEGCTCGFYAARSREHLLATEYGLYSVHAQDGWQRLPKVIGEVEFAGKVIPAVNGFRAMRARPRRILVPYEFHRFVKPLRLAYRGAAEVELANTLLLPLARTPGWCLGCGVLLPKRQLRCCVCGHDHSSNP